MKNVFQECWCGKQRIKNFTFMVNVNNPIERAYYESNVTDCVYFIYNLKHNRSLCRTSETVQKCGRNKRTEKTKHAGAIQNNDSGISKAIC